MPERPAITNVWANSTKNRPFPTGRWHQTDAERQELIESLPPAERPRSALRVNEMLAAWSRLTRAEMQKLDRSVIAEMQRFSPPHIVWAEPLWAQPRFEVSHSDIKMDE